MDKHKLILPVAILLASLVLGGFFYATQINKQNSIERQQEVKLTEERRIEEQRLVQENKEYIAKRKNECYDLYEKERAKWNNVKSQSYNEENDVCVVRYRATDQWKGKDCNDYLPTEETSSFARKYLLESYFNCTDNSFTNEF